MRENWVARVTEALLYAVFVAGCLLWTSLPFFLDHLLLFFMDAYIALQWYRTFVLIFMMCTGAAGLFIVFDLIGLFRTLRRDPFVERNVKALKRMGFTALVVTIMFGVKCVVYFTPMTLVCALVLLLCALFAFVLSGLFATAVQYKRENELTI